MELLTTPNFDRQYKRYLKKHKTFSNDLNKTERLLEKRFFQGVNGLISPDKLHRIRLSSEYGVSMWKIEAMQVGLPSKKWPRIWFGVLQDKLILLSLCSHVDNYDNNEIDRTSWTLLEEYFID